MSRIPNKNNSLTRNYINTIIQTIRENISTKIMYLSWKYVNSSYFSPSILRRKSKTSAIFSLLPPLSLSFSLLFPCYGVFCIGLVTP